MNVHKWKWISLILFLTLVVIAFGWVSEKVNAQKEVSRYVTLVNKWNEEQQILQTRYKDEVLHEVDPKVALKQLRSIQEANDDLLRKVERFKTEYTELSLSAIHYEKALHAISDAYQLFYYAIDMNEKDLLHQGEASLEQADKYFLQHEEALSTLAKDNFVQLK